MKREIAYLWLIAALASIFWFAQKVKAQTGNIDIVYPGKPAPLFTEINWAPGQKVAKQVIILNNSSSPRDLGLQILNISGSSELLPVLILEVSGSSLLLSSPLIDLAYPNEKFVVQVPPGSTQLNLSIFFDGRADNQYQNKKISFDMKFGFLSKETPPVQPPTTLLPPITPSGALLSARRLGGGLMRTTPLAVTVPSQEVVPPSGPTPPSAPEVLGEEAQKKLVGGLPLWAWILIGLMLLALLLFFFRRRRKGQE